MILWWWAAAAWAESWCAVPLVVHEWGVTVLRPDGSVPQTPALPGWFHRGGTGAPTGDVPVRTLPADSGIRSLPVVQLYASQAFGDSVPVALEVGFAHGTASVWFPAVDTLRPPGPGVPPQLTWEALTAGFQGKASQPAEQDWVQRLREVPDALWISRGAESDRFLFYEATTRESPAVRVTRGADPQRHPERLWVENLTDWPVHDVVVSEGDRATLIPSIPARGKALAVLEAHDPVSLKQRLHARWVDSQAASPREFRMDMDDCRMMRNPAVPEQRALDHRLYGAEVDILLDTWSDRLFGSRSLRVIYREDVAALDSLMPLSVYTDMYHYVAMSRLGVVLVEYP